VRSEVHHQIPWERPLVGLEGGRLGEARGVLGAQAAPRRGVPRGQVGDEGEHARRACRLRARLRSCVAPTRPDVLGARTPARSATSADHDSPIMGSQH
jgi:hypothetical protein